MDWLPLKCMGLEYRVTRNGVMGFHRKTAFLSHKHINDRNDEQTLIQEQITEKMSRLCWTTLRPRPLFQRLTHRFPLKPHSVTFTRSSSQSHLKQKMFRSGERRVGKEVYI